MSDLFDPRRHEPLGDAAWDVGRARRAIDSIVSDIRAQASHAGTWAVHPREDAPEGELPYRNLYFGSVGVTLGLDHLVRIGVAEPGPTFAEHLPEHLAANRRMLAKFGAQTRSYLMGDAGVRLVEWRAGGASEAADALAQAVAANVDDPTRELMWGAPGTMLASLAMRRWTGEARWADLFRRAVDALDRSRVDDDGGVIWVQDLYGRQASLLGAVHGFAGIALALIAGRDLIEPQTWSRLSPALARSLEASALRGEAGVNWAPALAGQSSLPALVQICHGAPGMIYGFAELEEPIDTLLAAAGELVWRAGPLTKGANFCHGTDGNGYAFLKLFSRTGDALWLDRARAFAMHAIAQSEVEAAAVGRRRASLWTGDVGLAAYLADCIDGRCRFPSLEFGD